MQAVGDQVRTHRPWITSLFKLMLFHPEAVCGLSYVLGFCLKLNPSGDSAACRNSPCTSLMFLLAIFPSTGLTACLLKTYNREGGSMLGGYQCSSDQFVWLQLLQRTAFCAVPFSWKNVH